MQARLITATNADLHDKMATGAFRRDLYYRLNVFAIHLPPLRERGRDVIEIALHFVRHFNREFAKTMQGITPEAQQLLLSYEWPGNIRELRNAIERAVLIGSRTEIRPQDLAIQSAAASGRAPPDGRRHSQRDGRRRRRGPRNQGPRRTA